MSRFLNVTSELGKLEAVLLHKPGKELENLIPDYLDELLFEDIPWLKRIREEHDAFARVLAGEGCEVLYYETLLRELLEKGETRAAVIGDLLEGTFLDEDSFKQWLAGFLGEQDSGELTEILISGLRKEDVKFPQENQVLSSFIRQGYPFYINPLANLYFTRDPGVIIGGKLLLSTMRRSARRRETFLLDCIRRYHPRFAPEAGDEVIRGGEDPRSSNSLEGGDVLVLSGSTLIMGCSSRSSAGGIERAAVRLFQREKIKEVLVLEIPFIRAYMHLDTVLTMVDRDKFTIFPGIEDSLSVFSLTPGKGGGVFIREEPNLKEALKRTLGLPAVKFIYSGGQNEISAAREQWNDSTNTLAVAPGRVVTYNRNEASNETLRQNGVEVLEIEGSELVRGRGGPRCMSMPLRRRDLD